MQPIPHLTRHVVQRWGHRAPYGLRRRSDLQLVLRTGRVLRTRGTRQYLRGLGMIVVVDQGVAITCWRVRRHTWMAAHRPPMPLPERSLRVKVPC